MKTIWMSAFVVTLGQAPLQCSRTPDPSLQREESPGDALWALANDFRAHGNESASTETLRFLVQRYPSSRFAPAARERLNGRLDAGP